MTRGGCLEDREVCEWGALLFVWGFGVAGRGGIAGGGLAKDGGRGGGGARETNPVGKRNAQLVIHTVAMLQI